MPSPEAERPSDPSLDAVETVRRHPEWYFRSGVFDPFEAASLLVEEASREGATMIEMRREGDWFRVSADVDWLSGDLAAFFAPLSYPGGGRNSSRVEVILTAFCDAVVTASAGVAHEVASSPGALLREAGLYPLDAGAGRVIAFLPPASSATAGRQEAGVGARAALRLLQGRGEEQITAAVASFIAKQASA